MTHDSPTTQVWPGGSSRDKHRIIRWASDGIYSSRKTYAVFGFRLVEGVPGRMYDFHTQPNDVGGWAPPCNPYRIAPLAIDYWGVHSEWGLIAVAQPEESGCTGGSGKYHFEILSQSEIEARRGQWVWLWAEITWGRRDIGTKGALKVWVAGEDTPRVNVSGINTHWPDEEMVTFWEGQYDSTGADRTNVVEIAATRFGRTPQEAFEDRPVRKSSDPASSVVPIAARDATESTVPSPLRWASSPPPAPANPKLHVKKVVIGATTSPNAFSFSVSNGGGTHAFEADGENQLTLPAGTYTVTEPAVSGWTTTYAGCSNVVLSSTQSTVPTCTITNTKQQTSPPPAPSTDQMSEQTPAVPSSPKQAPAPRSEPPATPSSAPTPTPPPKTMAPLAPQDEDENTDRSERAVHPRAPGQIVRGLSPTQSSTHATATTAIANGSEGKLAVPQPERWADGWSNRTRVGRLPLTVAAVKPTTTPSWRGRGDTVPMPERWANRWSNRTGLGRFARTLTFAAVKPPGWVGGDAVLKPERWAHRWSKRKSVDRFQLTLAGVKPLTPRQEGSLRVLSSHSHEVSPWQHDACGLVAQIRATSRAPIPSQLAC
jgi:hypothetical protein